MSAPLLEARNLRKWYKLGGGLFAQPTTYLKAVDDVSFTLNEGEILGIAGESGSGKSTIGRSVLGLTDLTEGQLLFEGKDVGAFGRQARRDFRRLSQIIFQDPFASLDPRMSIGQIIAEPLMIQRGLRDRAGTRRAVNEMLDLVALPADFANRMPHELSGGQRQRVVIARALITRPRFIVADEPVSALDVSIQAQIIALLKKLQQELKLSMLFISHDLAVMEYLSDRIAVVYLGKIMEVADAATIAARPHHPYTLALVSSVTRIADRSGRKRLVLKGDVPNPIDPPSGCVFRTRCPFAIDACAKAAPLRQVASGHLSTCIRDDII